ncbi:uncharacterized protein LOC122627608 [Vespula pensylvanica]|uniref:uncharacterized protein LOC122627608 n=1 Tax=Vespula pensylvanica TaxID=30213 RepID=UPI001CB9DB35|nr:uncharacterized protein LOC122627608 [Vespula pensylvanica]
MYKSQLTTSILILKFTYVYMYISSQKKINTSQKKIEVAEDPGGAGEGKNAKKGKRFTKYDLGKRWHRFRVLTPTSSILRGSFAMNDIHFKFRSRGRQAAPCSVVAIVYGRLFEPKEWIQDYVDQVIEYGDKLFRISMMRNRVKENEYMKAILVHPEFYIGNYKILICVEETGIYGNLFSEAAGCSDFADGVIQFFDSNDAGIITAQGTSVAMWRHSDVGFLLFDPGPCGENGLRHQNGVACLLRFKCMNDMRNHFLKNMNRYYDSRYCIDKITILRVTEVGRGYIDKVTDGTDLVVDRSVLRSINPVDIDENKMDCTKPVPKSEKIKVIPGAKFHKEPLTITISNYSIDKKFATEPLVDQSTFDTGYPYDNMQVNVPSTFRELPRKMAILHGLTHEASDMYKGKGGQNVANCVMAIAMKKIHPVKTWLRPKLDEILTLGDQLYSTIKTEKPFIKTMTAADLNDTYIQVEDHKLAIDVDLMTITGTVTSKLLDILNLKQALHEFFLVNSEGIIETPLMAVAIWTQDDFYYAFDPRYCDNLGNRIIEERVKGGKGANSNATKQVHGKCCVIRFPESDDLAVWFTKNLEQTRKNDRFTIRHITIPEDIPGTRAWNDFEPGTSGKTWILRGGISNEDELFEDNSRGIQGLTIPVVSLIIAKETPPAKWTNEVIDEVIRDGDAYYNVCYPPELMLEERPLLVSNLKKNFYLKNRKVKFELDDSVITGDLNPTPGQEVLNLEEGIKKFFENYQYGIVEVGNLAVGIWKFDEDMKYKLCDKNDEKVTYYYCFDPNPRGRLGYAGVAVGEEENVACVIRTLNPADLSSLIAGNAPISRGRGNEYFIHNLKSLSVGTPMTEDELETDKQTPEEPEVYHYSRLAEGGAILQGSFNQANEKTFKRLMRDKQQAASSLAALAMTKLYNPHLWYREVVDDILKIGDKVATNNVNNLPEADIDEEARNFLLPMEVSENFAIGVNQMNITVEEEFLTGRLNEINRLLEQFFENNTMCVIRQDNIMMAVWKEGETFFMMDPRGRDSRGEPSERDPAAVMWFTNLPSLIDKIRIGFIEGETDIILENVTLNNAFQTRVSEMERVTRTTSGDDLWHHFPKFDDGVWSIGGNVKMSDARFDESNRNNQTAAIATMAIIFSKVCEPRYWTTDVVDEVIITGDKLHSKCVERLGEGKVPRINEIITEFFLSSRRIDLTVKDCIEAGDLSGKPPKLQNLQNGLDKFFQNYDSGILVANDNRHIPIWKFQDIYYTLIPDWITRTDEEETIAPRVFRFNNTTTLFEYLLNHLGREGDYEITAIDVVDWNKLAPWKFDPSPAVRPSNLPPLNAYRRLQGEARAILRGKYHQGDDVFPEILRNKQTAANCVVSLGMSVIKNPITWTKKTMNEILLIGSNVHRETMKAKPGKLRVVPQDIIRIFYVGVNILTADIESNTVSGIVSIPPVDPEEKKKKKKAVKKKAAGKKARAVRVRAPPPPPILLEEGLKKFFENNRAGILVTGRGMIAIWKDMGVYFMYDPRARNNQGLPDFYGTSCVMWFACMEPFYELIFANIDEQEKYTTYQISRVIINTAMIEPLPCPADFRPYFDCIAPPIPLTTMKRTTTLAVEVVTDYYVVDEEQSVLRGTLHMNHPLFDTRNRGLQSTAIAVVAIVVGLLHVPSSWTPELIDAILKYGDLLHSDSVRAARPGARNLSPSELLTVFIVGDFRATIHIHNHTAAGLLLVYDLSETLNMFFRTNCAGILHTTNMAVAVMQHYGKFYLFDPCSRNEQGLPSFEGAACVIKCDNIMRMAKIFIMNCNLKTPNVYTLNAVNILSLHFFSDAKSSCPIKCEQ